MRYSPGDRVEVWFPCGVWQPATVGEAPGLNPDYLAVRFDSTATHGPWLRVVERAHVRRLPDARPYLVPAGEPPDGRLHGVTPPRRPATLPVPPRSRSHPSRRPVPQPGGVPVWHLSS